MQQEKNVQPTEDTSRENMSFEGYKPWTETLREMNL